MNSGEMSSAGGDGPSGRAVRMWLGLLVAFWILVQVVATIVCYFQMAEGPLSRGEHPAVFYRLYATALGTAGLAMLFVVGGVGLILNRSWGQRTILVGACLQIALTVATQVLEVFTPLPNGEGLLRGPLAAPLGILLWSVIPVGILILAAAAKPPKAAGS
jgi:phage-related protein